jgi:phosphate transport system protein
MKTSQVEPVRLAETNDGRNKALQPELRRLTLDVCALGRILEKAIVESVAALRQRVSGGGEPLITLDHQISKKRFAIEMDCISLIVAQQPLDGDLRTITSMLEIVTELEHIGNYVTDIARIHFQVVKVEEPLLDLLADVQTMADRTQEMLHQALEAFLNRDLALAQSVHGADDEVDALYNQFYRDLLVFMKGQSRGMIKQARYLARIARNMERAADRVTNICEWVVFTISGTMVNEMDTSTSDDPFAEERV